MQGSRFVSRRWGREAEAVANFGPWVFFFGSKKKRWKSVELRYFSIESSWLFHFGMLMAYDVMVYEWIPPHKWLKKPYPKKHSIWKPVGSRSQTKGSKWGRTTTSYGSCLVGGWTTHLKMFFSSNWINFPKDRGENKEYLKPPPSFSSPICNVHKSIIWSIFFHFDLKIPLKLFSNHSDLMFLALNHSVSQISIGRSISSLAVSDDSFLFKSKSQISFPSPVATLDD